MVGGKGIYVEYFPTHPPGRTTVEVQALPGGAHIEITAFALAVVNPKGLEGLQEEGRLPCRRSPFSVVLNVKAKLDTRLVTCYTYA